MDYEYINRAQTYRNNNKKFRQTRMRNSTNEMKLFANAAFLSFYYISSKVSVRINIPKTIFKLSITHKNYFYK